MCRCETTIIIKGSNYQRVGWYHHDMYLLVFLWPVQVVTRERQKLEDEIEANRNAQNTVSKAVRNLNKVCDKLLRPDRFLVRHQAHQCCTLLSLIHVIQNKASVVKQIHDKEIVIGNVKNELARIQVGCIHCHCQLVSKTMNH